MTTQYIVLTPILGKGGKTIPAGASVDLGEDDAAALLACGAVRKSDQMLEQERAETEAATKKTAKT